MRKLACCLAVASAFVTAPASAALITTAEAQSLVSAVANYLQSNPSVFTSAGLTQADYQLLVQTYQSAAASPNLASYVTTANSLIQSSSNCQGIGTFPSINNTAFSNCVQDVANGIVQNNPNLSQQQMMEAAAVSGAAIAKSAGMPLTVNGVAIPSAVNTPATTPTPSIPATTLETIKQQVVPQIQRATSIQQASIISDVVSNIFASRAPNSPRAPMRMSLSGEQGMAAGGHGSKLNAWVNASESKLGNSSTANLFDGKVTNAIGGVDYMVNDALVAGVSLGHDRVALDLKFNNAATTGFVSTGWMIAPYASFQINETLSVDGALGYAEGNVTTGATKQNYKRDFLALNLTATHWMKDLQITGKVNYISANEKVDTTSKMEQLRLGGQVGYWMDGIMPYASLTYVRDLKISSGISAPATSPDKEAWVGAIGANLFSKGAVYGGLAYTQEFGRSDSKNKTFMFNVGYRF